MKNKKNKILEVLFFVIIFLFFFIFFYKIHPIMFLDTDDWYFSYFSREAYPIIGNWNPTRVLPEILMPFSLMTGLHFMSLFSNNYLNSITIINSFVVSIFLVIYVNSFYRLIKKKFNLNMACNILLVIVFIILHFLIFRRFYRNNYYMFNTVDAACYYYYIIPAVISCSLVMFYLCHDSFVFKDNVYKTGFMVLVIYLTLLSNIYSSVILVTFIGATLLVRMIDDKLFKKKNLNKKKIFAFIKKNCYEVIIIISWIIIHLIELTGGRATDIAVDHQAGYFTMLGEVLTNVGYLMRCLNILFVILMVISFIIINYIMIKKKMYKNRKVIALFISFVLSAIYIILLSAKTYTHYIYRMEVIFVVIFYIFLFMCFAFAYVLKNYKKTFIIFPVLVLIMAFDIHTADRTFRESNYADLTLKQNKIINERIVEQIKNADGKPGTVIYIPYFDHPINWPIPLEYVERIPKALYKHGVIDEYTELKFEISKDYYKDILGE